MFGGLELQALREELEVARQQRAILLEQAAALEAQNPGVAVVDAASTLPPWPTTQAPAPAPAPASTGPRKLSWGTSPSRPSTAGNALSPPPAAQPFGAPPPSVDTSTRSSSGQRDTPTKQRPSSASSSTAPSQQQQPRAISPGPANVGHAGSSASYEQASMSSSAAAAVGPNRSGGAMQGPHAWPDAVGPEQWEPLQQQQQQRRDGEEAVRRRVLREVLAVMLGDPAGASSSRLDHYRLDPASVAAVARQQGENAAKEARSGSQDAAARGAREGAERAAREARERAERELERVRAQAEAERKELQGQLERARKEAEAAQRERRALLGKSGQQAREARDSAQALQAAQEKATTLERALSRAQANVEAARVDGDKRVKQLESTLTAAREECAAAQGQAAAATKAKQQAAAAQERAEKEAAAATAAAEAAGARAAAAQSASDAMQREAEASVEEVAAQLGECMSCMQQQLEQLGQDIATLKNEATSAVPKTLREGLQQLRGDAMAAAEAFGAAARAAAQRHVSKLQQLVGMDRQLASLGPEGLDGLCKELHAARSQLAQLRAERDSAQRELQRSEAERQRAALDRQLQQAEVQMLLQAQTDLNRGLAQERAAKEAAAAEAATLRKHLSQLKAQLSEATDAAAASATQHAEVQARLTAELDAARNAARAARAAASVARRQAAADVQAAVRAAARLVRQLRWKLFQQDLSPPRASGDGECSQHEKAHGAGGEACGSSGTASAPAPATAAPEGPEVVGLRLCHLTHGQIMEGLEDYCRRQAQAAAEAAAGSREQIEGDEWAQSEVEGAAEAAALRRTSSGGGSSGERIRDDSAQQQPATVAPGRAVEQVERAVGRELLWLEGCVLLVLVELRQKARQLQEGAEGGPCGNASAGGSSPMRGQPGPAGSTDGGGAAGLARNLVGQMMRAMAREKKELQRKLHQVTSLTADPPAPFTAYAPLRRSLSARSATGSLSAHSIAAMTPPLPHAGESRLSRPFSSTSTRSCPEGRGQQSSSGSAAAPPVLQGWASSVSNVGPDPGCSGPNLHALREATGTRPHAEQQQQQQQHLCGDEGPQACMGMPGADAAAAGWGPLAGTTTAPTSTRPITPSRTSYDLSDVVDVLQVLDDAGLRSSRGMAGLRALQPTPSSMQGASPSRGAWARSASPSSVGAWARAEKDPWRAAGPTSSRGTAPAAGVGAFGLARNPSWQRQGLPGRATDASTNQQSPYLQQVAGSAGLSRQPSSAHVRQNEALFRGGNSHA